MSSLPYDSPNQTTSNESESPTQTTETQTFNRGFYVTVRITNYTKFERREMKSRLALDLKRTKDLINRIEEEQNGKSTIQVPKKKRSYNRKTEKLKLPDGWKVLKKSIRKSGDPTKTYQDPDGRFTPFRSVKTIYTFLDDKILPKNVKLRARVPVTSVGAAGKKKNAKRKKDDAHDAAVNNKKADGWLR